MGARRIVSGSVILDNLPWWLALPAGLALGAVIGITLVQSETSAITLVVGVLVLGAGLWLGLSTPRPAPPQKLSAPVATHQPEAPGSHI